MSKEKTTICTYDGQKFELQGQSVEQYQQWLKETLAAMGKDLASKLPMFYGKVEFNIQNGKFVNANMTQGFK